jgi:hypothetical protein
VTENRSVGGSIPPLGTTLKSNEFRVDLPPKASRSNQPPFVREPLCGPIWPDLTLHQAMAIGLAGSCASAPTSNPAASGRASPALPSSIDGRMRPTKSSSFHSPVLAGATARVYLASNGQYLPPPGNVSEKE